MAIAHVDLMNSRAVRFVQGLAEAPIALRQAEDFMAADARSRHSFVGFAFQDFCAGLTAAESATARRSVNSPKLYRRRCLEIARAPRMIEERSWNHPVERPE
jgi:hypothetical protein